MRTLKGWIGHRDIQPTQRYADHCQNPGESDIVQSAFAQVPVQVPACARRSEQTSRKDSPWDATTHARDEQRVRVPPPEPHFPRRRAAAVGPPG
jgi:hypothetical protein